jgi:hypothetical protein
MGKLGREYLREIAEEYENWTGKGWKIKKVQPKIYVKGFAPEQVYYQIKTPTDIAIEEAKEFLAMANSISRGDPPEPEEVIEEVVEEVVEEGEEESEEETSGEVVDDPSDASRMGERESETEEDEDTEDRETIRDYLEGEFESDSDLMEEAAIDTLKRLEKKI